MRTTNYNEYLTEQLQDKIYRKEFLSQLISPTDDEDDPVDLFTSIKLIISIMGVTEFAKLVGMERSAVSRMQSQTHLPKIETLDRLLKPFGLAVKLDVQDVS